MTFSAFHLFEIIGALGDLRILQQLKSDRKLPINLLSSIVQRM